MESAPVYAEPGWLLFARQGVLAAQSWFPVNPSSVVAIIGASALALAALKRGSLQAGVHILH
jgi:hypothetical protein